MLIEYDGGSKECSSAEEIVVALRLRNENSINEFWISFNEPYPCLAILVKDDIASINYFFKENDAGFRAINSPANLNEEVFILIGGNEYCIPCDGQFLFDNVISAVLQFYDTHMRPENLFWEKL